MSSVQESIRIVIAGASSLLGSELREQLGESRFGTADFRLVDEEYAAGTLAEVGGEAAVIQAAEEESFALARFVFFTASPEFTKVNVAAARRTGGTVIDLSGGVLGLPEARAWFSRDHSPQPGASLYSVLSAPGTIAARLSESLAHAGLSRLGIVFFRPVSEAGRAGIEELENQTSQLLSFQNVGQQVFDAQVAFSLLNRYGEASMQSLANVRARIRAEASLAVGKNGVAPSIQMFHAPVFYGYTFAALGQLNSSVTRENLNAICEKAGFVLAKEGEAPLGNLTAAGDDAIHLALPEADSAQAGTWWFWGAADNLKLPVTNAVALAEKLL